jgi:hypothetical protein
VKTASEILQCVVDLYSKPNTWTQKSFGRAANGMATNWDDPTACSFCMEGAVYQCRDKAYSGDAFAALMNTRPSDTVNIVEANDHILKSQDEAKAWAEKARDWAKEHSL